MKLCVICVNSQLDNPEALASHQSGAHSNASEICTKCEVKKCFETKGCSLSSPKANHGTEMILLISPNSNCGRICYSASTRIAEFGLQRFDLN
ncbi:hypothetical protein CRG98_010285 [Punica granatum]|uniref:Uncharacterized protein n=1 Tax=Punica granatum TaxID=22663 RepID=A0A2I0KLB5_PUNGR|nr:hypothetical protein CRG98_010285 [Punica granatum]